MRDNAVKLLKHTQELCLNFENIFETFSNKISYPNLLEKRSITLNDFIDHSTGSYIKDYFFGHNGYVKVFRMLICAGDAQEYIPYQHICNQLQIDNRLPLILIYGIIKPVKSLTKSSLRLEEIMNTCSGFSTKDEMKFDWSNFEDIKKNIAFGDIFIENKKWTPKEAKENAFLPWNEYFSNATIRIKNIFDIHDSKDIEELIQELEKMEI
ncbi:MAG: hypothetical protein KU29_06345 [Sulfurovum sp. FS06-10]|nr:MAG: hypothetical protein KU29_06345 [Sulfurovum sp. FS06-10]